MRENESTRRAHGKKLAKTFDWKGFHEEGIRIARLIAAQLPDTCELWYTIPWEDTTNVMPKATLIKGAK